MLIVAVLAVTVLIAGTMQHPDALPTEAKTRSEALNLIDGRLQYVGAPSYTIHANGASESMSTFAVQLDTPAAQSALASMLAKPTATSAAKGAAFSNPAATPAVMTAVIAMPAPPLTPEPAVRPAAAGAYASQSEVEATLATTAWPRELWPTVLAIAYCESGIDSDRDGHYDSVDTLASGAGGLYIGVMQIDVKHHFSSQYDLRALRDNLAAGHELWVRAGHSFAPWGCH